MARKVVGFGEDDLRALAGTRSFERGLGYLNAVTGGVVLHVHVRWPPPAAARRRLWV
ncbi:hypothetical protein [Streptomyces sp. NPDC054794]